MVKPSNDNYQLLYGFFISWCTIKKSLYTNDFKKDKFYKALSKES